MTLVATLLVRDEIDVVAATIEHVLDQGAELVVATDNGSVDGTRDVLAAYRDAGVLHLIDEPDHTYRQSEWVTRMARWATQRGADWLLHLDADEFWVPVDRRRRLADVLESLPAEQGLVVAHRTDLVRRRGTSGHWPRDLVWRNLHTVSERGTPLAPKVCHRADPGVTVVQGNHGVEGQTWETAPAGLVDLYHVPLRSWEQFARKIDNGGSSYAANTELDPEVGWHWRADHERLQAGTLRATYDSRLISPRRLARGLASGALRYDPYLRGRLEELVDRAVLPDQLRAVARG